MSLPEGLFEERQKHLLGWEDGPVLAHVEDGGTLRVTFPSRNGVPRAPRGIEVSGDALLHSPTSNAFVSFTLDGDRLAVTRHVLDGELRVWSTGLPAAPRGSWTLHDVIETESAAYGTGYVLTLADEDGEDEGSGEGEPTLLRVAEGAEPIVHRPRTAGRAVHWDDDSAVVLLQEDRGPLQPLLHAEPLGDRAAPHVPAAEGRWLDSRGGVALVLTDAPDAPRLALWNPRAATLRHLDTGPGSVADGRFTGDDTSCALVVSTDEGTDRLDLVNLDSGDSRPLETPGAGRLLIRVASPRGTGLYGLSTAGGTSYWWIGPDATVRWAPGAVPPDPALNRPEHTYFAQTPALVHKPPCTATAAVIALHGGPESQERDELRWDGLYRELLHQGVLVISLNYTGSSGYGADFLRRPWKDWAASFRLDLDACLGALRDMGVGPGRTALLGGSFGGSLALLGCVIEKDLAGAVASAPLTDIRKQAARAAVDDGRYAEWFALRYDLASPLPHERVFDPDHLAATGPKQRVVVIHGRNDRVTSFEDSGTVVARARERGLPWTLVSDESGHVPEAADEARFRYERVRDGLAAVLITPGTPAARPAPPGP
ncbi:alpha/beta hydrolase family protein [Streptomyces sp. NPDC085665]|uniref:alpha/beta hydrolase family protein n=1 Tax=Streptomyces sp. NPDC085665 TaxID=3365735 RepID=UPI0037D7DDA5